MKKFKFRLETLLNYKTRLEKMAKEKYQQALYVRNKEKKKLERMKKEKADMLVKYTKDAGKITKPIEFDLFQTYLLKLEYMITEQNVVLDEAEEELNSRLSTWNSRRKELKVLTKIKETQWKKFVTEFDKSIQSFQDDIYLAKKIRERTYEKG